MSLSLTRAHASLYNREPWFNGQLVLIIYYYAQCIKKLILGDSVEYYNY